jgi:2-keto-4-pentenoate hydratase/2-oxohepta-3-ene-1,7-dioic acid hydratase in catechol pathway
MIRVVNDGRRGRHARPLHPRGGVGEDVHPIENENQMRMIAYESPSGPIMGAVEGDMVQPLATVDAFYADPDSHRGSVHGPAIALAGVVQVPPVPTTARILCIGLNYPLHIEETKSRRPDHPNLFARWPSTLVVDGASTPVPPGETGLDWEVELAAVIGKEMLAVDRADAMDGVLGYTCFNDISARTFQRATPQWALGKNPDNSGPIGPCIVTADELGDPYALRIESRYNGRTVQSSVTGNMIFRIDETIEYITQAITLRPGDIIATGTPDGVGSRMDPPVLMVAGDEIEIEIEGIGKVKTHIV